MIERFEMRRTEPITLALPMEDEDLIFGDFDAAGEFGLPFIREAEMLAPMDVFNEGGQTVIRIELPGMTMEDVDISVVEGMLTIKGEKKAAKEVSESNCYCSERTYGKFERRIQFPEKLDQDKIHATLEDGILEVVLPEVKGRKGLKRQIRAKTTQVRTEATRIEEAVKSVTGDNEELTPGEAAAELLTGVPYEGALEPEPEEMVSLEMRKTVGLLTEIQSEPTPAEEESEKLISIAMR